MRQTSLYLALVIAATTRSGQTPLAQVKPGESPTPAAMMSAQVKLGESPTLLFVSPGSSGCPIGLTAERRSAPVISTIGNVPRQPSTQAIQLHFIHYPARNIEQVTVILHGLSGRSRIMPAGTASSSDVEETFHLTRAADASSLTASYLRPRKIRTTQWIELTSVDYADGSIWRASREAQCTVTPSNFVLISAH